MKSVSIALGMLAVALLAATAIPFDVCLPALESLSADGAVASFTPERYARLRIAEAAIAISLAVAAAYLHRSPAALQHGAAAPIASGCELRCLFGVALRDSAGAVAACTLLALGLRLPYLNQPLRYDEAYTWLEYASQPLYLGLSLYHDPNNHLGHTLLVHLASLVCGRSPWACRLPAFVAGTLLAPACAMLVRSWGRTASWIAGLAIAAHPLLIEFSTLARGYMVQALLIVVLISLTWNAARSTEAPRIGGWSLIAAAALWTLPTSLYAVAGCLIGLLLQSRGERRRLRLIGKLALLTGLLTVGLYAPVLVFSGPAAILDNPYVRPLTGVEFIDRIPAAAARAGEYLARDCPAYVIALWSAALSTALALATERRSLQSLTAGLLLGAGLIVLQRVHPPERVWLDYLPLAIMLGSIGWSTMLQAAARFPGLRAAMALVALAAIATPFVESMRNESIRRSLEGGAFPGAGAAAAVLHAQQRPGEPVLAACPAHAPLVYYALQFGMNRHDFPARWPPASTASSVLLVVNQANGETAEGLLRVYELHRESRTARLDTLAEGPGWQVCRVTRAAPPQPE